MVRVEMLAVGKELLIGRTLNSNALWVGRRLARMGSMIKEITTVDDELDEIGAAVLAIVRRSPDFLVVVGGLGPTPDDMTLKGIARALRLRLERNAEALRLIRAHYIERGMDEAALTPPRVKMAILPAGSKPLQNDIGTAPGVRLVSGRTVVFCLPGVPAEMRSIFRKSVEPEVRAKVGKVFRRCFTMRIEGVPESALAPSLAEEMRTHPGAYIKSHPKGTMEGRSRIVLDIVVAGPDKVRVDEEGEVIASKMRRAVVVLKGTVVAVRSSD
ncbi:MAG: competence damage-inducible protein A [Nitrososphaerota archaeon]|nr:competence damage-inducible protein A [Nitrososphaerota archaeon]MDG6941741.1 competence damage-inducible protein A [Nitrososphaerota archaeon]MDG6947086.1 competence damage-inducible protein A [Nitrososphaerota archaeon]MDG6951365.1 competence damage-inducible protein A [Nitrososphaerota archaeon]